MVLFRWKHSWARPELLLFCGTRPPIFVQVISPLSLDVSNRICYWEGLLCWLGSKFFFFFLLERSVRYPRSWSFFHLSLTIPQRDAVFFDPKWDFLFLAERWICWLFCIFSFWDCGCRPAYILWEGGMD